MYEVTIPNRVMRGLDKLPDDVQDVFWLLVDELRAKGAIRKDWDNFSSLGRHRYHCHVKRKHVACWMWIKGSIFIEIYYAGSREGAPY
jgi:hypothetical protein